MKNPLHPNIRIEERARTKRSEGLLPAAAHRSRASQKKEVVEREMNAADTPYNTDVDSQVPGEVTDELAAAPPAFIDSEEPPPPQLRRARSNRDPAHKVLDKNTGIKHREASGKKHYPLKERQERERKESEKEEPPQ